MVVKALTDLRDWVDDRFPLIQLWNDHMGKYYAPKNFNFWYMFGVFSLVVLVIQIVTKGNEPQWTNRCQAQGLVEFGLGFTWRWRRSSLRFRFSAFSCLSCRQLRSCCLPATFWRGRPRNSTPLCSSRGCLGLFCRTGNNGVVFDYIFVASRSPS